MLLPVRAATGMNSATTMLLALVPAGGHIVTTTDCYRRTRQFIQTVLPKMGISATVIDPADMEGLEQALKSQRVSLFFSGELGCCCCEWLLCWTGSSQGSCGAVKPFIHGGY